jgi:hypothetical protein
MAHLETNWRVVVEFLKSSAPGRGRVIRFNHRGDALPPQLAGRVAPQAWAALMADADALAASHPYVQRPSGKDYGKWAACFALGSVIGVFCIKSDAGDYGEWTAQAQAVVAKHAPALAAAGVQLSLQKGQSYMFHLDIVGAAQPALPLHHAPPSPFESSKRP